MRPGAVLIYTVYMMRLLYQKKKTVKRFSTLKKPQIEFKYSVENLTDLSGNQNID